MHQGIPQRRQGLGEARKQKRIVEMRGVELPYQRKAHQQQYAPYCGIRHQSLDQRQPALYVKIGRDVVDDIVDLGTNGEKRNGICHGQPAYLASTGVWNSMSW